MRPALDGRQTASNSRLQSAPGWRTKKCYQYLFLFAVITRERAPIYPNHRCSIPQRKVWVHEISDFATLLDDTARVVRLVKTSFHQSEKAQRSGSRCFIPGAKLESCPPRITSNVTLVRTDRAMDCFRRADAPVTFTMSFRSIPGRNLYYQCCLEIRPLRFSRGGILRRISILTPRSTL